MVITHHNTSWSSCFSWSNWSLRHAARWFGPHGVSKMCISFKLCFELRPLQECCDSSQSSPNSLIQCWCIFEKITFKKTSANKLPTKSPCCLLGCRWIGWTNKKSGACPSSWCGPMLWPMVLCGLPGFQVKIPGFQLNDPPWNCRNLPPENRPKPNRKGSYSNSNHPFFNIFQGELLVSGRVYGSLSRSNIILWGN